MPGALAACGAVVQRCGLPADDLIVLHDSNRLAVHVRPSDVLARVAPQSRRRGAAFEVEVATRLAATGAPLAPLDPRVEPRVHDEGAFAVTLWTFFPPASPPRSAEPAEYADALRRLHVAMAPVADLRVPHFLDRVDEAQALLGDPANDALLGAEDRELLAATLRTKRRAIVDRRAPEQLLHGEPHPGNVLRTSEGLRFVDLETCCRGPLEFDLAHTAVNGQGPPLDVADHYPGADPSLVRDCWVLMLAMIVAWRCEPGDDLPDGRALTRQWIRQLRAAVG